MNIFNDFVQPIERSTIVKLLIDNDLIEQNNLDHVEDEDQIDVHDENSFFDFNLFEKLETPVEQLRYFVLYQLQDRDDLHLIMTKLIVDVRTVINYDNFVIIKTLLTLFSYEADFIPSDSSIHEILYKSIIDEELTNDSFILIILYYRKFGLIFSNDQIIGLIIFSLQNDNKCRTYIWKYLIRMILYHSYSLSIELSSEIIQLFDSCKTIDKYLVTHIILSMLVSNDENKETMHKLFVKYENLLENILVSCAEGKNTITVTAILHFIKDYDNFGKFLNVVDYIENKKDENNMK